MTIVVKNLLDVIPKQSVPEVSWIEGDTSSNSRLDSIIKGQTRFNTFGILSYQLISSLDGIVSNKKT